MPGEQVNLQVSSVKTRPGPRQPAGAGATDVTRLTSIDVSHVLKYTTVLEQSSSSRVPRRDVVAETPVESSLAVTISFQRTTAGAELQFSVYLSRRLSKGLNEDERKAGRQAGCPRPGQRIWTFDDERSG